MSLFGEKFFKPDIFQPPAEAVVEPVQMETSRGSIKAIRGALVASTVLLAAWSAVATTQYAKSISFDAAASDGGYRFSVEGSEREQWARELIRQTDPTMNEAKKKSPDEVLRIFDSIASEIAKRR